MCVKICLKLNSGYVNQFSSLSMSSALLSTFKNVQKDNFIPKCLTSLHNTSLHNTNQCVIDTNLATHQASPDKFCVKDPNLAPYRSSLVRAGQCVNGTNTAPYHTKPGKCSSVCEY